MTTKLFAAVNTYGTVTGRFPKPPEIQELPKSAYLDDLNPPVGSVVICKSAINCSGFTPGQSYRVFEGPCLIDDNGKTVRPSARFYRHIMTPTLTGGYKP